MTKCHYYDFHFRWHALFTTEKSTCYQVVQDYGVDSQYDCSWRLTGWIKLPQIVAAFYHTIFYTCRFQHTACRMTKFPRTASSNSLLCVLWHKSNASKLQQPSGEKCMPSTPASCCLFRCWFVKQDRGHCVYHEDDASSLASGQYHRHPRGHSRKEKSTR